MTNEKHMIIHCWSWGHWFYKKNKYSLTLYFPDCSVFFSCSHRTTLMSSFEPFLVCHFPRSSEVAAATMACIKVKMAGCKEATVYGRIIMKFLYICLESSPESSRIYPRLKIYSEREAILSQKNAQELQNTTSCITNCFSRRVKDPEVWQEKELTIVWWELTREKDEGQDQSMKPFCCYFHFPEWSTEFH